MMNKQEQRTFGITENLLNKPVPRFYGAGDHKVQLAYITPDEADLLSALDLHGSNPPNPGPEGIPNFNDPGTGMSGVAASAAEAGSQASSSDAAQAAAEGVGGFVTGGGGMVTGGGGLVTSGGMGIGPDGSVNYGNPNRDVALGPSANLGAGEDPDSQKSDSEKKGFLQSVTDAMKTKFSPQGLIGTAIGYALFGPVGGFILGNMAGTYGDDDPSNNALGNIGQAFQTDVENTKNFFKDDEGKFSLGNLMDGIGSLFGPAPDIDNNQGGNRPPIDSTGLIDTLPEEIPPIEETPIETMTFTPNYGGAFQFDPTTNSFGFRP